MYGTDEEDSGLSRDVPASAPPHAPLLRFAGVDEDDTWEPNVIRGIDWQGVFSKGGYRQGSVEPTVNSFLSFLRNMPPVDIPHPGICAARQHRSFVCAGRSGFGVVRPI